MASYVPTVEQKYHRSGSVSSTNSKIDDKVTYPVLNSVIPTENMFEISVLLFCGTHPILNS